METLFNLYLPTQCIWFLQIMKRLSSVEWPGGGGPRATTLQTMGQQMMELAAQYAEKVTHAYISIATQPNNIPAEASIIQLFMELTEILKNIDLFRLDIFSILNAQN